MITRVYIIESPSDSDLLVSRTEGATLAKYLELAQIQSVYFLVVSNATLRQSFAQIADEIHQLCLANADVDGMFIHISAHGNDHGIGLTDGTFISWLALSDLLDEINVKFNGTADGTFSPDLPWSLISLTLSTCLGLRAAESIMTKPEKQPCAILIGANEEIPWEDGLIGFTTYYHNAITKNLKGQVAVEKMKQASSNNAFDFRLSPEFQEMIRKKELNRSN